MTIHYHGTPITPSTVLQQLAGKHFCVSIEDPRDLRICKVVGQSIMFDNGAFSAYRSGKEVNWNRFYRWVDENANRHNDWAVIPDVIGGTEAENNELMLQWPFSKNLGAPVWHLNESFRRLHDLAWSGYRRICFGSSGKYWQVGSYRWLSRVEAAFDLLCPRQGGQPPVAIHMLRGMSVAGSRFPFASVDSANFARNHNRFATIEEKLDFIHKMDGANCPMWWTQSPNAKPESFELSRCVYDGVGEQKKLF